MQFGIGSGGTTEVVHRGRPAQDLFDGVVEFAVDITSEQAVLVEILHECPHAPRRGVASGLVASHCEQHHEHVELELGEAITFDLGIDELGDDVVARVSAAGLGQFIDVHEQFGRCGGAVFVGELGIVDADHAVRPVEQHHAVFLRHTHDLGDGLQWQLGSDIDDEVARSSLDDVVNDENGSVLEILLDKTDHARGETLVDEQAITRVLRRVHVEHHQAAGIAARSSREFVRGEDGDAAGFGGVQAGVAVDRDQILVLHDVPEALGTRIVVPTHRRFSAQSVEHLVMLKPLETVEVKQVDSF
ncbi:unannotated protein [freshwater metagenome]|uniref:Unannotated protein n=1 Tax=freshwater metagenome TaxID=449393 RepID=A0A6J5YCZ2_9ZZZZ